MVPSPVPIIVKSSAPDIGIRPTICCLRVLIITRLYRTTSKQKVSEFVALLRKHMSRFSPLSLFLFLSLFLPRILAYVCLSMKFSSGTGRKARKRVQMEIFEQYSRLIFSHVLRHFEQVRIS